MIDFSFFQDSVQSRNIGDWYILNRPHPSTFQKISFWRWELKNVLLEVAHVYGIELTSKFDLKAMAGNIIPAIATTNAIAAGMVTLQAKKILSGHSNDCVDLFITSDPTRSNYFVRSKYCPPSPDCKTCFVHRAIMRCNPAHFTLNDTIEMVIPLFLKHLNNSEVTTEALSVLQGARMIYDEEDMPLSASKSLNELDSGDSKLLRFEFLEGLPLVVAIISDDSFSDAEYGVIFDLLPQDQVILGTKRGHEAEDDDESDLEFIDPESDLEIIEPPTKKRSE